MKFLLYVVQTTARLSALNFVQHLVDEVGWSASNLESCWREIDCYWLEYNMVGALRWVGEGVGQATAT